MNNKNYNDIYFRKSKINDAQKYSDQTWDYYDVALLKLKLNLYLKTKLFLYLPLNFPKTNSIKFYSQF